ncbi:DUF2515 family protein [Bacillus sp. SG-1]|uniref:DUF2515 family protein n=1 Tax=Bacillus sp. SG-1 TaxID=161544 RepID=UPI000308B0E6|nr:DUF2515 family protein [Bacillus sp. SG-1]
MNKISFFQPFLPDSSHVETPEHLISIIREKTFQYNRDNISRTKAYQKYYLLHPEIKWSFLASMVSRNAGWNMCDLKGAWFPAVIDKETRKDLFLTYERANWLIFQDVFPQLLIYHYKTEMDEEMFHLLREFFVSDFMQNEWKRFREEGDRDRLMQSLIINEQNVIEEPVIQHPVYKRRVFKTKLFFLEDHFHFSSVVFPTKGGNLYGASVSDFRKLDSRISLGNRLSKILFKEDLYFLFKEFALSTEPTGSRRDYERYCKDAPFTGTPLLRTVYGVKEHHIHTPLGDWSQRRKVKEKWFRRSQFKEPVKLTKWYFQKQRQLQKLIKIEELFRKE